MKTYHGGEDMTHTAKHWERGDLAAAVRQGAAALAQAEGGES